MYIYITLKIKDGFELNTIALLDSSADQNCIKEGLIPSIYYEKTKERLQIANGMALQIKVSTIKCLYMQSRILFQKLIHFSTRYKSISYPWNSLLHSNLSI